MSDQKKNVAIITLQEICYLVFAARDRITTQKPNEVSTSHFQAVIINFPNTPNKKYVGVSNNSPFP
jgi:hypothetical protein